MILLLLLHHSFYVVIDKDFNNSFSFLIEPIILECYKNLTLQYDSFFYNTLKFLILQFSSVFYITILYFVLQCDSLVTFHFILHYNSLFHLALLD